MEQQPKISKNFRLTQYERIYQVKHNFHEQMNLLRVGSEVDKLFASMVAHDLDLAGDKDLVSVAISHPELTPDLYVSFRRKSDFTPASFLNRIFEVMQSNNAFTLDGEFTVRVSIVKRRSGGAPRIQKLVRSANQDAKSSTSVVTIKSRDQECGHKAIYLGLWNLVFSQGLNDKEKKNQWRNLRRQREGKTDQLEVLSKRYCEDKGIDWNQPVIIPDTIEEYVSAMENGIQILVFARQEDQDRKLAKLVYSSHRVKDKEIHLELVESEEFGHFHLITNITGYLKEKNYCYDCNKKCRFPCSHDEIGEKIRYPRTCDKCLSGYVGSDHKCLEYRCKNCDEVHNGVHGCFIKPKNLEKLLKEDSKPLVYVFFDVESQFVDRSGVNFP